MAVNPYQADELDYLDLAIRHAPSIYRAVKTGYNLYQGFKPSWEKRQRESISIAGTKRRRVQGPKRRGMVYGGVSAYQGVFKGKRKRTKPQKANQVIAHFGGEVLPPIAVPATPTIAEAKKPVYMISTCLMRNPMIECFGKTIIYRLFKKGKTTIRNFDESIILPAGKSMRIIWEYHSSFDTAAEISFGSLTYSSVVTYETVVQNLLNTWAGYVNDYTKFKKIQYNFYTAGSPDVHDEPNAELWLEGSRMTVDCLKTHTFQNRTGAGDPTVLNTNNVEHNPIQGYIGFLNGSVVHPAFSLDAAVSEVWAPDVNTGFRAINATGTTYDALLTKSLARVQPGQFNDISSHYRFHLQPGACKKIARKFRVTGEFNSLYNKFWHDLLHGLYNGTGTDVFIDNGKALVMAAEKMTQTGTGTAPVTVGYDVTGYFNGFFKERRRPKEFAYIQEL